MADSSPVRLPPAGSAQRVFARLLLSALGATVLELVGLGLQPGDMKEASWPAPEHAAYWAAFAASIPLVTRACDAARGAWRVLIVAACGGYLAPIACLLVAGRVAALARGAVSGAAGWGQAGAALGNLATQWPPYATWWFGHPAAFLIVYLLGSGLTPRVPAPAVALVAYVVQAVAHVLFCMAMHRELDLRWFDWRGPGWEGAWPAFAVLSAGAATWLEARLALWLTARREERARRG